MNSSTWGTWQSGFHCFISTGTAARGGMFHWLADTVHQQGAEILDLARFGNQGSKSPYRKGRCI